MFDLSVGVVRDLSVAENHFSAFLAVGGRHVGENVGVRKPLLVCLTMELEELAWTSRSLKVRSSELVI